jgi:Amt family ammonium transporter
VGGTLGATLNGFLATNAVNDALKLANGQPAPLGWVDGNPGQVLNQLAGAGTAILLAVVGTFAALKICSAVVGIRMEERDETTGMDLAVHGEEGYNYDA